MFKLPAEENDDGYDDEEIALIFEADGNKLILNSFQFSYPKSIRFRP